jgi:integrase
VPAFGRLRLRQVTRARLEAYVADLDEAGTLSRKSINNSLIPLRGVLDRAVRDGIIVRNPARSVDRDDPLELPYEAPEMRYLRAEEARAYLDAWPAWYRPLGEFLIATGARIGEAIALEWRDVDLDAGHVRIGRSAKVGGVGGTKGDRARLVPLDPQVLDVLRRRRRDDARPQQRAEARPRRGGEGRRARREPEAARPAPGYELDLGDVVADLGPGAVDQVGRTLGRRPR